MRTLGRFGLAVAAALVLAAPARAAQVCGWLHEYIDKDEIHSFDLYLEADGDADIYYMIKGQGVTSQGSRAHSPGSGTYVLHRGRTEKVWGFGTGVDPGAQIDIIAEIHEYPADVFSEKEPPLLGVFTFRRKVPDDETTIPKTFAARQCVTAPPPRPPRPPAETR